MPAIAAVVGFLFVGGFVVRLASYALNETGLADRVARFQSWSALTGTGFTTREAELMVDHPLRRRIALGLFILGAAGFTSILAGSISGFVTAADGGDVAGRALLLVGGLVLVVAIYRSQTVDRWMRRMSIRRIRNWVQSGENVLTLAQVGHDRVVSALIVIPTSPLLGRTIREVTAMAPQLEVLAVRRADASFVDRPPESHSIGEADALIVYGSHEDISSLTEPNRT